MSGAELMLWTAYGVFDAEQMKATALRTKWCGSVMCDASAGSPSRQQCQAENENLQS